MNGKKIEELDAEEQKKAFEESGVDIESFWEHGLTLKPTPRGSFELVKKGEKNE